MYAKSIALFLVATTGLVNCMPARAELRNMRRQESEPTLDTGLSSTNVTSRPTDTVPVGGTASPQTTCSPDGAPVAAPDGNSQENAASNCNCWDFVHTGQTCETIVNNHASKGLTLDQFLQMNPDVGSNCTTMWANAYVCTSVAGELGSGALGAGTNLTSGAGTNISTSGDTSLSSPSSSDGMYGASTLPTAESDTTTQVSSQGLDDASGGEN